MLKSLLITLLDALFDWLVKLDEANTVRDWIEAKKDKLKDDASR